MTGGSTGPGVVRAAMGTVFPSRRTRLTFAGALAGVTLVMLGLAALKWQAPLLGLVGLGLPMLFALYLWESGTLRRDVGAVSMVVPVGIVLGVGWETGNEWILGHYGPDALGMPMTPGRLLVTHVALPLSYVALLAVPVVLVCARRYRNRDSLSGYRIGALGAYFYAAAATLTGLASDFDDGLMAEANRAASELAAATLIEGVLIPMIAAAVGGSIGATLWRAPTSNGQTRPQRLRLDSPVTATASGALLYLILEVFDSTTETWVLDMVGYVAVAIAALVLQRRVLRATGVRSGDHAPRGTSTPTLVSITVVAAVVICAASAGLALWLTPPAPNYVCPPDCGRPPLREPVTTNPRFTPSDGAFSVSYPGAGTAYTADFQPHGVLLTLLAGEGGTLHLFGEPAMGRTAHRVVEDVIADAHPDARVDYEIPNALVGYQLGYGVVADVYPADSIGGRERLRLLIMAAVKDDYALIAAGAGPFREFSPEFGSGHPSGANFLLALDMGKYVNSFAWRGDPPR